MRQKNNTRIYNVFKNYRFVNEIVIYKKNTNFNFFLICYTFKKMTIEPVEYV